MGRAIDLFVTYRFLRLLTTPFEDTDPDYKLGIIDEKGNRIMQKRAKNWRLNLSLQNKKIPTQFYTN